jgi:glycosyltransferase involved in cell wall biosynthesis
MNPHSSPAPAKDAPDISVVAPCYNEEAVLHEFYRRLTAVADSLGLTFEIVLIDDGSRDRTWDVMQTLSASDPRLVCVKLSRNHGHQLALTAGLTMCRGKRILVIDADLQDPPELLPQMLELMNQGAEVVYGQRRQRAGESTVKLATASIFYRCLNRLTDVPIPKDTGDFRLISRRVLDLFLAMPERQRFIRGMISWLGFRQVPLLYDRDPRYAGETKYPMRKMCRLAVDAVTSFSTRPLVLASVLGLLFSTVAFGLLGYAIFSWLFLDTVPGWTSNMVVITLLGGIQLLVLGIQGEYIGRLYEQAKGRPLFLIDQVVSGNSAPVLAAPVSNGEIQQVSQSARQPPVTCATN